MDEQRSQVARARAELALVRLLHEMGDHAPFLVVMGGLTPALLAADVPGADEHLGTTDVDVLLITQVGDAEDLNAVETALENVGFDPDPREDGWRWRGSVDGVRVKIEFLCDLDDHPEGEVLRPEGCVNLSAQNLRGTRYVATGFSWQELIHTGFDGDQLL